MISFDCLSSIQKIIENEKFYKIQILTTEPAFTILNMLKMMEIKVNVFFLSLHQKKDTENVLNKNANNQNINIIINDCHKNVLKFYSHKNFILIGGRIIFSLLHITLKITEEDSFKYLSEILSNNQNDLICSTNNNDEFIASKQDMPINKYYSKIRLHIKKYHKIYSLYQLKRMLEGKIKFTKTSLTFIESVVILSVINHHKFSEIQKNVLKITDKINNSFDILLILNKLIRYNFIIKTGNNYFLHISKDYAYEICKKIGFDIKKEQEIRKCT